MHAYEQRANKNNSNSNNVDEIISVGHKILISKTEKLDASKSTIFQTNNTSKRKKSDLNEDNDDSNDKNESVKKINTSSSTSS